LAARASGRPVLEDAATVDVAASRAPPHERDPIPSATTTSVASRVLIV
jgi:hypothetical protein